MSGKLPVDLISDHLLVLVKLRFTSINTYLVKCDLHRGVGLHHNLGPGFLQLGVVVELALDVNPAGRGVKLLKQ